MKTLTLTPEQLELLRDLVDGRMQDLDFSVYEQEEFLKHRQRNIRERAERRLPGLREELKRWYEIIPAFEEAQ